MDKLDENKSELVSGGQNISGSDPNHPWEILDIENSVKNNTHIKTGPGGNSYADPVPYSQTNIRSERINPDVELIL